MILKRSQLLFVISAYCSAMLIIAFFMEYYLGLKPCILCQFQRLCIFVMLLTSIAALLHKSQSLISFRAYLISIQALVFLAIYLSVRQLYLQSLPDELIPNCAPDLNYLLETLPISKVLLLALKGDGNCSEVVWSFLGISIPGWTLVSYSLISVYMFFNLKSSRDIHSYFGKS